MKADSYCPNYRVRLFLSVDLTDSTAYKHASRDVLDWVRHFRAFYRTFPILLRRSYEEICGHNAANYSQFEKKNPPRKWKTVGDEIVFCCTLRSQYHLSACMRAFMQAVKAYSKKLDHTPLDTKGNAWTASFPTPNYIIPAAEDTDDGQDLLPTEAEEERGDTHPHEYDFLGKEIDAGFRIARNATTNALTISPALGELLCDLACKEIPGYEELTVYFEEMQIFKGVAGDRSYPVLYLDTCRNPQYRALVKRQRYLLGRRRPDPRYLRDYLHDYLDFFEIEEPCLPQMQDMPYKLPEFYLRYRQAWEQETASLTEESNK